MPISKFLAHISTPIALSALVFIAFATLTLASYRYAGQREHERIAHAFHELATLKAQRVQLRVEGYARTLLDLRGLFVADPNVTEFEFHRFLHGVGVTRRYPAMQRIGYAELITAGNRARVEGRLRQLGLSELALGIGDIPIQYRFPQSREMLGQNLKMGPLRSHILELARDSSEPRMTPQLPLRFENDGKPGHAMYVALYGADLAPPTVAQRRNALSGYLFAVFRTEDVVGSTIGPDLAHRMGLALFDGSAPDSSKLIYDSGGVARLAAHDMARKFTSIQRIDVSGRPWTFMFVARPAFVRGNQSMQPLTVLAGGLLTSVLAAWLAYAAARRVQVESQIRHLAFHDELTGLPNRAKLRLGIEAEIRRQRDTQQPCALLMVELVRFREINYTMGHQIGDEVLMQAGARIRQEVDDAALVARINNVQFGVLLPDADSSAAIDCARRLVRALQEPLPARASKYEVGARVGIVLVPRHGADIDELLRHADIARNLARSAGTDYVIYDPQLDPYQPRRLALLGAFRQAVKDEQLQLYVQPKADLRTGCITSVEALVRWEHPEFGLVMPDQFISLIEPTELIHLLTQRMLECAMAQSRAWRREGMAVPLSVNLSTRNLLNPALPDLLNSLMQTWDADASWIELEITESSLFASDSAMPLRVLDSLHAMGFKFSIDDFGTGYSSLSYLTKLPITVIKIDHSFTRNMLKDPDAAAIVRAIIELAHTMGMKVVAEGTATLEIWDALKRLDCDEAQGYYICQPLPAADFSSWLASSPWKLAPPAALPVSQSTSAGG